MEIADRLLIRVISILLLSATSRFAKAGLLLCCALIVPISGQIKGELTEFKQAQSEFDNGNYQKAIELSKVGIKEARKNKSNLKISKGLDIIASAQISLEQYEEAINTLNTSLQEISGNESNTYQTSLIYIRFAWLFRSQYKFAEALGYSHKALALTPNNRTIEAEHWLNIGRILFASGYDISAIIWLEKAEKVLETESGNSSKLDVYRFLTLAWSSQMKYQTALKYAEKWVSSAEKTQFKYKHGQALFELATILSATGQKERAFRTLEKGLKFSVMQKSDYQAGKFLNSLLLHSLYNDNVTKATEYLNRLEKIDAENQFSFEILLGQAIISAFNQQPDVAEKHFAELEKQENSSEFVLLYWKITIAERNREWEQVIKLNQNLLELTEKNNFLDGLPDIYLTFAKAHFQLDQPHVSLSYLEKSLSYIEEIRKSENQNLSLGLFETYHNAYRLLAQIKSDKPNESYSLADFLKARFLKDKINNSKAKNELTISLQARKLLEDLSLKYIEDNSLAAELERNERLITTKIPESNLKKIDVTELGQISSLENSAIISYLFTVDKKLLAFVWVKGKPLQTIELPISVDEVEIVAAKTQQNIKNRVFFKRDGQAIYEKLVKPLKLTANHLIIVPDKSLWKIPFQALSSDGEKYLIEEKLISYAPSVSILLEQLKSPKPDRQSLLAFANSSFENKVLQYVNAEASNVAEIYNSKPIINATVNDFSQITEKADILHFSMHAEVDNEQPLDSFLGFRKFGRDDGRLTVEELLSIKLKQGSLVFLASCDTNNVFNGEGLVSLAWGMLASGATTVISAQWEANDKSTAVFTNSFYTNYKQGNSTAEAMQKASLELIKNKSNNMHEPYYWADFGLYGDFR